MASNTESETIGRNRSCDRCEREIHDLEPAAVIQFHAAIESDELVVCVDCGQLLVEWWEAREPEEDADD